MGVIEAVCMSTEKGVVKEAVGEIVLREGWGIEGDAHAGDWHRQVSLLAAESIDRMRAKVPDLDHGMFAENIVTRGVDMLSLSPGDLLQAGDGVVLEVTQIGKECHNDGCAIQRATGDCIMPREGVFCRVVQGGQLRAGMSFAIL
ncbi:MAG: MOSC domain-containing protein [Chlorobium sp.]|uniref:MOSC domain-containing protein n=1 Tax=Chlorobium sp. TaxID=1095 RepID=UPI001E075C85|nr:MOSC domain-containing protein [Chlorobium sp.]MBN1278888.1 MOSC domain-containing protein [Chlorobiaceae bacterium]MCF8216733.1 MOSC domain-containing protein [Chlorobium sp.]MCF8271592.1 MOSC domain-containing protein [Chlorobium sp.]MCF8287973.1 MOSC domain-containing protein [Chlorobium sp.]MCF8291509.1 MOSC domain-containing protein [Chlorobium sp.]